VAVSPADTVIPFGVFEHDLKARCKRSTMVTQVANLGKRSHAAAAPWGIVSREIHTPSQASQMSECRYRGEPK
jgi:hypothetical protein